jgi:hypothetical protein
MEQGGAAGTAAARLAANNPLSSTEVVGTVTVVADNTCLTAPTIPTRIDNNSSNRIAEGPGSYMAANLMAQPKAELAKASVTPTPGLQISSKDNISTVLTKATPKASAAEVARIYRSEQPISHHAVRKNAFSQGPNAPTAGEIVTLNTIPTFPAAGKSITIKYSATVNTTVLTARQASTQGTVTANGGINVTTTDPGPPVVAARYYAYVDGGYGHRLEHRY